MRLGEPSEDKGEESAEAAVEDCRADFDQRVPGSSISAAWIERK